MRIYTKESSSGLTRGFKAGKKGEAVRRGVGNEGLGIQNGFGTEVPEGKNESVECKKLRLSWS